jgi:nucleoside-diphosphate-sugar epimerase
VRTALVTGSAGFVGRHMCAALESAGWNVHWVDLRGPAALDARVFFRAATDMRPDLVVHAAAHVGGRADIDGRPTFVGAYNLQLDGALFEWALRARPGAVVYLSSSAAYPVALQTGVPPRALAECDIDLAAPSLPDATYGWTKLTGERLAAEARAEGLRVHVVRPFSGYGTDQDNAYPFPAFIGRAQRRADPFAVWGDGRQVRDWIHIEDVCAAVLAVVDQGVDVPVNLCTGRPVSMTELAGMVASAAGYRPRVEPVGGPAGVLHRVGDPTLLRTVYEPKICLEDGVRRALAG